MYCSGDVELIPVFGTPGEASFTVYHHTAAVMASTTSTAVIHVTDRAVFIDSLSLLPVKLR